MKKKSKGYRLPTEAEWEYAGRGGPLHSSFIYSGSDLLDSVGWYDGNSVKKPHPVKLKQPNALGLYDMSGNVGEWCLDWFDWFSDKPEVNPIGPSRRGAGKVSKGGYYGNGNVNVLRLDARRAGEPTDVQPYYGFRVARTY